MVASRGFKPRWSGSGITVSSHHAEGIYGVFLTLFYVAVSRGVSHPKMLEIFKGSCPWPPSREVKHETDKGVLSPAGSHTSQWLRGSLKAQAERKVDFPKAWSLRDCRYSTHSWEEPTLSLSSNTAPLQTVFQRTPSECTHSASRSPNTPARHLSNSNLSRWPETKRWQF